ncbi:MAG: hypothetical protein ACPG41_08015 [Lacinutrix venerupis]
MKYITLALLLSFSFCFAQKTYEFDTLLEYECRFNTTKSDTTVTQYLYTNSKDNSYYISVRDYDSLHYSLNFYAYNKYHSQVKVIKSKLFKSAEIDILDCETIHNSSSKYKFRTKEYDFVNLKDTLVNNTLNKTYKLSYLKSKKKKKRRKIGTIQYIIKPNTEYHLPVLYHITAYNEWDKERNIPNGIFKEYIFYNYNDEITNHYKLKEIKHTAVKLNVTKPCPPTMTIQK